MKEKFEEIYEGKDYIDAIEALLGNLKQRNDEVNSYSIHNWCDWHAEINMYIYDANKIVKDVKKGKIILSLPRLNELETDIQKWFNYLDEREKEERKLRIRDGLTLGIGVLLAPTGIPAGIIGFKTIKKLLEELGD